MVFDPKLQGGVAYNQPVSQPNAMEAVAGLFNFGLSSMASNASNAPKPTEGEKFDYAVHSFVAEKGATTPGNPFAWDRKTRREFIFRYPQFASEFKAYEEGTGLSLTPQEVALDSAQKWFETDEGIVAVAYANTLPESDREAYLSEQVGAVKKQEAAIAKLERDAKQLAAQGTLDQAQWDALKPTSKTFVDNTVATILGPILDEIYLGNTVEITPEQQAALGIRYSTIDLRNINAVLADTKRYLSNSFNNKYRNTFGKDTLAAEAWQKEVFAGIDALIETGKQFDSPQEQAAFTKALIDTQLYKKLDENGVALVARMAEVIPGDTLGRILGDMVQFDDAFTNALAGNGSMFTTVQIKSNVANSSTTEAVQLGKDAVEVLDKGFIPEVFTLFTSSNERAGYSIIDDASFRSVIGQNADEIIKHTNSDPEAREEMSNFLMKDIQGTLAAIESALPTSVDLVTNSQGQLSLVYVGSGPTSRAEAAMGRDAFIAAELGKARSSLPEGLSIEGLNSKLSTLKVLGPLGKEVQDAIGILNKPEEKPTVTKSEKNAPTGSKLVPDEEWIPIRNGIFQGESGGDYDALFGYTNREGGRFSNVKLTEMTVDEAIAFADPGGEYGQWVKGQVGRVATPMGAYQIVGTTLKAAKAGLGLTGSEVMTPELQDMLGQWIYLQQGTGAWEGYAGPRDSYTPLAGGGTAGAEARREGVQVAIDNPGRVVPESARGPVASTESLSAGVLTFESPEVQQLIEKANTEPAAAIAIAKELIKKPIDPSIKALIQALVNIGAPN